MGGSNLISDLNKHGIVVQQSLQASFEGGLMHCVIGDTITISPH